jgi:hypothetical protein
MANSTRDPIFTLHRYFIWANRMRTHFDDVLGKLKPGETIIWGSVPFLEAQMYMSYWYGGLHVVAEGWRELRLSDAEIDTLLDTPTGRKVERPACGESAADVVDETVLDLLRRYRNGAFHYQRDYFDDRFEDFMKVEQSAAWARTLNKAFGRYFLEWLKQREKPG